MNVWSRCVLCDRSAAELFFFKQKTAYEMRISDWSSDMCSSDLLDIPLFGIASRRAGVGDDRVHRCRPHLRHHIVDGFAVDDLAALFIDDLALEIGRASCRERVCQYV